MNKYEICGMAGYIYFGCEIHHEDGFNALD